MDEVSYLKLKLVGMEEEQNHMDEQQKHHKAEVLYQSVSSYRAVGSSVRRWYLFNIILL